MVEIFYLPIWATYTVIALVTVTVIAAVINKIINLSSVADKAGEEVKKANEVLLSWMKKSPLVVVGIILIAIPVVALAFNSLSQNLVYGSLGIGAGVIALGLFAYAISLDSDVNRPVFWQFAFGMSCIGTAVAVAILTFSASCMLGVIWLCLLLAGIGYYFFVVRK